MTAPHQIPIAIPAIAGLAIAGATIALGFSYALYRWVNQPPPARAIDAEMAGS